MKKQDQISDWTRKYLDFQGYSNYSDAELSQIKYGIRLAYILCGTVVLIGLVLQNPIVLGVAMVIAFGGTVLSYHPFDVLYNSVFRHIIKKPAMPKRTNQNQFACGLATVTIAAIILLIQYGYIMTANILGGTLLLQAFTVGFIDFCVPSMIYNSLFGQAEKKK